MHRQIKIVAILLMIEGGLEIVMGGVYCILGPVMMAFMRSAPPPSSGAAPPPPEMFGAIYIAMGVATILGGILKVVGGVRNVSLKSRVLGFIALGSGLLSFASCYCIPTALGLGIYGIIVYVNQKSAEAFAMAESGMPPDQVFAQLDGLVPMQQQPYPPQYPPQYPPYPPQ